MAIKDWNWKLILRITHISACAGAMFCGIWGFYAEKITFKSILINLYVIGFPLLIILGELNLPFIARKFRFLATHAGRSMTILFVGSLLFIFNHPQNIALGIFTLLVVIMDLWIAVWVRPEFVEQERKEAAAAVRSAGVDAKATVSSGVAQGMREAADDSTPSWAKPLKSNTDSQTTALASEPAFSPDTEPSQSASAATAAPASGVPSWASGIVDKSATSRSQVDPSTASDSDPHANPFR
eukprot:c8167_g1_i1.p1 GENE.c8167_g1_i1~~c8167_g1_i1.p1  ORF type:complete len:261 (-),score=74.92 c8167_g1_i1:253-972(-)